MADEKQQAILDMAERIARAFIDGYHEDELFDQLKAEGDDPMGLTPYANSMRGALSVMGELGIYGPEIEVEVVITCGQAHPQQDVRCFSQHTRTERVRLRASDS